MKLSQRCISTKNKLSDSGKIQKAIEAIKNNKLMKLMEYIMAYLFYVIKFQ